MKQTQYYFVYILFCYGNGHLYIGFSSNYKQRLLKHQQGKVTSTRKSLPVELIYLEVFKNIKDAKSREVYLKSGNGRKQLKEMLKNTLIEKNYKYL
ncbi:MAG: GIY-YIG nuclease family protein [Patescibacteria group bacterium]